MKKKILMLLVLVIVSVGCKSKKSYSDSQRTKNVLSERNKNANTPQYGYENGSRKDADDTFIRFRIETIPEYIDTFSAVAQTEMKTYGIPASITLAQGLLESGYGKGELALKTNNHFGIKCHTGWQGDYDFHDDDEKGECFRKYNHPLYSFRDHSVFLATRNRYAFLFDYKTTDYKKWAHGLKKAGYATDKKYPHKLISLIEKYELYKYDGTIKKKDYNNTIGATVSNAVHVVEKGDTLYSLSRKYYVSVDELKQMNNLKSSGLSIGQKLMVKTTEINK